MNPEMIQRVKEKQPIWRTRYIFMEFTMDGAARQVKLKNRYKTERP
jgi:hypothetical protein